MITKKQKDNMLHALGRPKLRYDWKPKTNLDKCYRNKFYVDMPDLSWEELVTYNYAGLMKQRNYDGTMMYFYYVTEKGMKELLKQ